ncbi:hypothetical protein B0H15DRAFT_1027724 [Mycena belliarum]|uniref:Uncharacterized protein n=1 Tax=Mycena belliarum TaxID=1033014 RepID=A0AAD6XE60_9AGAR|nr:hypothetical protein B0H15DRAFT_1027724 [Mycena belliae]
MATQAPTSLLLSPMATGTDITDPPPGDPSDGKETTKGGAPKPGGPYLYYRVYSPDGVIPARSAFDTSDPFIGRIPVRSVPPPHNASSLARCFMNAEGLADPAATRTELYCDPFQVRRLAKLDKIPILGTGAILGRSVVTAFALVLDQELTFEEKAARPKNEDISTDGQPQEYLYYQLFTRVGEDTSDASFNETEPSIGRIPKFSIPPPHNYATLKRCIAKVEGKPIYAYADLFVNISAVHAAADPDLVFIGGKHGYGSTTDNPIVLVQPERRQGLYNRPVQVVAGERKGTLYHTDGTVLESEAYECVLFSGGCFPFDIPAKDLKFLDE